MRQIIVVSYFDGSAIRGAYGPYPGPEHAREAMKRLQDLPGMGDDDWKIFPLHELCLDQPQQDQPKDTPS